MNTRRGGLRIWDDGWTVATTTEVTAQFEHTLVVTDDGADILTCRELPRCNTETSVPRPASTQTHPPNCTFASLAGERERRSAGCRPTSDAGKSWASRAAGVCPHGIRLARQEQNMSNTLAAPSKAVRSAGRRPCRPGCRLRRAFVQPSSCSNRASTGLPSL